MQFSRHRGHWKIGIVKEYLADGDPEHTAYKLRLTVPDFN